MRILITGVGGTVGNAFVDLLHKDHEIIGVDRNETNVARLKAKYPELDIEVADFDEFVFAGKKIDLLIHLAAMKHIDLCESSPNSCVLNNVVKTYDLFEEAHMNGVQILFMSTDKAVEPTSAYGYSKALAEKMALERGGAIARSGNIVDSSGSVFGIWDEAIKNSEPIRITHPAMRRFFISPENLVKRIWDLYLAGEKVIIPEMDRDVFLMEILAEKLEENGLLDYLPGVKYIGLRPGEKLAEKLQ